MSLKLKIKLIFLLTQMIFVAASFHENIIDIECHNDTDCSEFQKMDNISNATCLNNHCLCKDSDLKAIQCLPQKVGLSNVIDGKCPCSDIKWSSCIAGFCACNSDFTASIDKRKCLPKLVAIGSPCEYDTQCSKRTTFAECKNNTCSCKAEFTFHDGACQSLVGPGKECESDKNCSLIPNTLCVSQQCICEPGFVVKFNRTSCLPNADYNDGCLESIQCQGKLGEGAVCEKGKCVCGEDFDKVSYNMANETKSICENRIAIGKVCSYDTDCFHSRYNGTEQSMKCSARECKCAEDFEEDRNSRFCIQSKIAERENTWFDFILMKVSSTFASSSGNRNTSFNYIIAFISSLILFI